MVEKVLDRAKVVYKPPERAFTGKVVISPFESPNHLKILLDDGSVRYVDMSSVVSITGSEK